MTLEVARRRRSPSGSPDWSVPHSTPSAPPTHNRWPRGWPLLTTLAGWSALMLGLARMFAPEARQPKRTAAVNGVLVAMFTSGVVLTCKAYRPDAHQQ